jgi:hypothetical protein
MKAAYKPEGYTSAAPYRIVDGAAQTIDFLVRVFDAVELRRTRMTLAGCGMPRFDWATRC